MSTAVVPSQADLTHELESVSKEHAELEVAVQEKEAEVRRAREELTLIKELATVNELALRRAQRDGGSSTLKVSEDTLEQIIGLEDRIKLADKKTKELQAVGDTLYKQQEIASRAVDEKLQRISHIKDFTGWERHNYASRGFTNEENQFKGNQKILRELEDKQTLLKDITTQLSKRIGDLTHELDDRKNIEEEIAKAKIMLSEKKAEYSKIEEDMKSCIRINQRKEKISSKPQDEYKEIKKIEGDKRALHADLMKIMDAKRSNEKSILAQDMRMRQIEARLEAIAGFLKALFDSQADSREHRPGVDETATAVPLTLFEEVQRELTAARLLIVDCDGKLDKLDADVEINEKKSHVYQKAVVARTGRAARAKEERNLDNQHWQSNMQVLQEEFELEYERLTMANEELHQKVVFLQQQQRQI